MCNDVLTLAGAGYKDRIEMFDFIIMEINSREEGWERLRALRKRLTNNKDELLGFALNLDRQLGKIAMAHSVPKYLLQRLKPETRDRYLVDINIRIAELLKFKDFRASVMSSGWNAV